MLALVSMGKLEIFLEVVPEIKLNKWDKKVVA